MIYLRHDVCLADDIRFAYEENGYYIILAVSKYIMRQSRISYCKSNISLKNATFKDFVSKLEIALKASNETSYCLKLMYETKRIDITTYQYTEKLCGNIRRLLIASCKTAKENVK